MVWWLWDLVSVRRLRGQTPSAPPFSHQITTNPRGLMVRSLNIAQRLRDQTSRVLIVGFNYISGQIRDATWQPAIGPCVSPILNHVTTTQCPVRPPCTTSFTSHHADINIPPQPFNHLIHVRSILSMWGPHVGASGATMWHSCATL